MPAAGYAYAILALLGKAGKSATSRVSRWTKIFTIIANQAKQSQPLPFGNASPAFCFSTRRYRNGIVTTY
ncbi:hypothetical protein [Nostoc sp.]|uniref:hypothetical protein n=1 Tax=Nostoc sp. TaxID=1180 RepID=UPI002FFAE9D2